MAKNNETIDRMQAIWNMIGGDDGADALISGRSKMEITPIKRLKHVGKVEIPAATEPFIAKDKFIKDSKEVKFYGIWGNFTKWFLEGDGVVDDPAEACEFRYANLTRPSVDESIIEELGGRAKVESTLVQIFSLLLKQSEGQEGVLLTNGYANIFYVKDLKGELRTVGVYWRSDGWRVDAVSIVDPGDWFAGARVFSPILES